MLRSAVLLRESLALLDTPRHMAHTTVHADPTTTRG
jgi:hypothetical protein